LGYIIWSSLAEKNKGRSEYLGGKGGHIDEAGAKRDKLGGADRKRGGADISLGKLMFSSKGMRGGRVQKKESSRPSNLGGVKINVAEMLERGKKSCEALRSEEKEP